MIRKRVVFDVRNQFWLNFFLGWSRDRLLKLVNMVAVHKPAITLELGCANGVLTDYLKADKQLVGLDIDRKSLSWAKKRVRHAEFVCADLCHLPFKKNCIDLVVCSSVLEHIKELERAVVELNIIIKEGGTLISGYPVDTALMRTVIELLNRQYVKVWNPRRVMTEKEFLEDPETHKQKHPEIRRVLLSYFKVLRKDKIPFVSFPDFLSIYECVLLVKKKTKPAKRNML